MSPTLMEIDLQRESIARPPGDERAGRRAGRTTRPVFAWFDAGTSIGWSQSEVDFVGCYTLERRMWAMFVVPSEE